MYFYQLYGLTVTSDIELPQLISISENELVTDKTIHIKEAPFPEHLKADFDTYYGFNLTTGYISNDYCYLLITNGNTIQYELKSPDFKPLVGAYILGWGMAMLIHQRGDLAIHGSCIANEKGAIIISGNSGTGKSTITNRLLKKGYRLMADDIALVTIPEKDKALAYPAFPFQKLCRDVAVKQDISLDEMIYIDEMKDKFLKPYEGNFSTEPMPLLGLVLLHKQEEEQFRANILTGLPKWQACMEAFFLAPLLEQAITQPIYAQPALTLAGAIPILSIYRGSKLDYRNQMEQSILDFIKCSLGGHSWN